MPGDAIIGKVAVKVIPDTKTFKIDLKKQLDEIEKEYNAKNPFKVKVEFDVDTTALKEKVKAVRDEIQATLRDIKAKVDVEEVVDVQPEISEVRSTRVKAALALLTRARNVPIRPVLDNKAARLTGLALAKMSGSFVLIEKLRFVRELVKDFDELAPRIAAVGLGIFALAGAALSASANLFALSSSLASIAPLALALPGILGGLAIGLGISFIALKNFNKELPGVKKQLSAIAAVINTNFWENARKPIEAMANDLLPKFKTEMGKTAGVLGTWFGTLAKGLDDALGPRLHTMFDYLNQSIVNAQGGVGGFANIIGILGTAGAKVLPRLGQWFADTSNKFADFLGKAEADGRLDQWINNAIDAMKALGNVIVQTARIFHGLASAATAAGGSTLGSLGAALKGIADVVNSEPFRTQLVGVFVAAFDMMNKIEQASGPALIAFFSSLATMLQVVLPIVGQTVGTLVQGIAEALANPALRSGIETMFGQIRSAVTSLAPIWQPLAQAIGALAPIVGQLVAAMAPLLAATAETLMPVLNAILPPISKLIGLLSGGLLDVLKAADPLIVSVGQAFGGVLGKAVEALTPVVPVLVDVLKKLFTVMGPIITDLINGLAPVLPVVGDAIKYVIKSLGPLLDAIQKLWDLISPVLIPVLRFLADVFVNALGGAIHGIIVAITGIVNILSGLIEFIKGIFTLNWSEAWQGIKDMFGGVVDLIKGIVQLLWNSVILGPFKDGFAAIKGLWEEGWGSVTSFFSGICDFITGLATRLWEGVKGFFSGGLQFIKDLWSSVWGWIKNTVVGAWDAITSGVSNGVSAVVQWFKDLPGKIWSALGDLGSLLFDAGVKILKGFVNGLQSMWNSVKDWFGNLTDKLTSWKGPEARDKILLYNAGQIIINGFINGLESRYGAVKDSLGGLTDDLAGGDYLGGLAVGGGALTAQVNGAAIQAQPGTQSTTRVLNYYAAEGSSISSEEDLFTAAGRSRMGAF